MSRLELADAANRHIWKATAKQCNLDAGTLGRYERGEIRWPNATYRAGLRAVLGVESDGELGFWPTPRGRLSQVAGMEARTPAEVVDAGVAIERLLRVESDYDHMPAALLLADASRLLADVAGRGDGRDELVAEAQAATLLGKIIWDASERRDSVAPRRYFDQAAAAAGRAGDRVSEASAWLRSCYIALYSDKSPVEALRLAWRTADVASASSPVLAGLGLLHAGEALGMLGIARDAEAALSQAEKHLERAPHDDPAATWFSPGTFDRMAGSIYLSLGDGSRAERVLQAALAGTREGSKAQAIVTGNIALALIRQNQPDQAATALSRAIDVLEATRGGGGMNVAFQAGRELAPWHDVEEVRDVRERLLALVSP